VPTKLTPQELGSQIIQVVPAKPSRFALHGTGWFCRAPLCGHSRFRGHDGFHDPSAAPAEGKGGVPADRRVGARPNHRRRRGKSSAGRNRGLDSGSPRVAGYGMSRVAAAARHYAQPGAFTAPCGGRLATAAPTTTRQSDMQCCVSFGGLLAFGPPAEPHNIPEPRQEPIEP
jgi:hypothetical protein